ncbi:serine/threonine-protein kinase [Streptomyces avicenniae]|uniref:serine/threonine-protein kinase n=1 Tax=Streptomyces avicenniae TaxID=500153 RepID=UPI00069B094D|nr:serine/threonine-protein kinase [Streptomyces avicenniae]
MEVLGAGDPRQLGGHQLLGRLGAGGMGAVYLARSELDRLVAVKTVRPDLAEQPQFRERFEREIRAAMRVGGNWVARVLSHNVETATPWVVTEYVPGPPLDEVVAEFGRLPEHSVVALANGLAQALRDIHAAGLVHRDLKPSNVLVTLDGPRIIDFGIAHVVTSAAERLTGTGATIGSPGFMSPEQLEPGAPLTPAGDLFTLGAVLTFAATGRTPFGPEDAEPLALMYAIRYGEPDLDGVPEGIRPLVAACLARDPAARPALDRILDVTLGRLDGVPRGWLPDRVLASVRARNDAIVSAAQEVTRPASPPASPYAPTVTAFPPPPPPTPAPAPPAPVRRRRPWIAAAAVAAVAAGVALAASLLPGGGEDGTAADSSPSATTTQDAPSTEGPPEVFVNSWLGSNESYIVDFSVDENGAGVLYWTSRYVMCEMTIRLTDEPYTDAEPVPGGAGAWLLDWEITQVSPDPGLGELCPATTADGVLWLDDLEGDFVGLGWRDEFTDGMQTAAQPEGRPFPTEVFGRYALPAEQMTEFWDLPATDGPWTLTLLNGAQGSVVATIAPPDRDATCSFRARLAAWDELSLAVGPFEPVDDCRVTQGEAPGTSVIGSDDGGESVTLEPLGQESLTLFADRIG